MAILSFPCCRTWHVPRPLNNKSPRAMGHWWGSRDEMPWTSLLMMFDVFHGQLPRSRSPTRSATMIISSTTLNSPQRALLGANVCTEGSVSFEWICSTHWSCMPQGALVDLRFFSAFATTAATTAVSATTTTTTTTTITITTATAAATAAAAAFTITTTTTTTPTVGIMKNAKPAQSIGGYAATRFSNFRLSLRYVDLKGRGDIILWNRHVCLMYTTVAFLVLDLQTAEMAAMDCARVSNHAAKHWT